MLLSIFALLIAFKWFALIAIIATLMTIFVLKQMHAKTTFGKKLINFFDFDDE